MTQNGLRVTGTWSAKTGISVSTSPGSEAAPSGKQLDLKNMTFVVITALVSLKTIFKGFWLLLLFFFLHESMLLLLLSSRKTRNRLCVTAEQLIGRFRHGDHGNYGEHGNYGNHANPCHHGNSGNHGKPALALLSLGPGS